MTFVKLMIKRCYYQEKNLLCFVLEKFKVELFVKLFRYFLVVLLRKGLHSGIFPARRPKVVELGTFAMADISAS